MSDVPKSPERQDTSLKADLDRLFSPEFADVQEDAERTVFLGAKTITRIYNLKNQPKKALRAAYDGLTSQNGYLQASFYRYQTAVSLFGIERITQDRISLVVNDYSYSGGPQNSVTYVNNVDMRKPRVEYDERLVSVVNACLNQVEE